MTESKRDPRRHEALDDWLSRADDLLGEMEKAGAFVVDTTGKVGAFVINNTVGRVLGDESEEAKDEDMAEAIAIEPAQAEAEEQPTGGFSPLDAIDALRKRLGL